MVFLFELTLIVLILAGWVTQMVVPIVRGSPLFPFFRRESVLRHQLKLQEQLKIETDLASQIRQNAQDLLKRRSQR